MAEWTPRAEHLAFAGFVSGGILSTLLDCHGNWTGAYLMMRQRSSSTLPPTVTAELSVKFLRPTPLRTLHLRAWAESLEGSRARVAGEVAAEGQTTATMTGTFVSVREGHPAFHRWE